MPKYSQVFLADNAICARIAGALDHEKFDQLIEIGPGGGALTACLFPKYQGRMTAVEIDASLVPALERKFKGLKLVTGDFLKLDLTLSAGPGRTAFIGNLPYECSTPILEKTLFFGGFSVAVFMFQREVARKILAVSGGSDYGYLSLLTASRAVAELVMDIKAESFSPVPAVDSSVLLFRPKVFFRDAAEERRFKEFAKKAFAHRRKTLVNSLSLCGIEKTAAAAALAKYGFKPAARAQEIPLEGFAVLAAELQK